MRKRPALSQRFDPANLGVYRNPNRYIIECFESPALRAKQLILRVKPPNKRTINITMKYLHTMVRVTDINASLFFYCDALGLTELKRYDYEQGRFTLVFLAAQGNESAQVELTHNWDPEPYDSGRNFGHLAYEVEDIYATCQRLVDHGVVINRPPRDGRMAFVRSPDGISIELLQQGEAQAPVAPWQDMENIGEW